MSITNFEVLIMLKKMVRSWFSPSASNYNEFMKAFLQDDIKAMNVYMNRVATSVLVSLIQGKCRLKLQNRNDFITGLFLGLIVDLEERYSITTNRESGFGRYDVMLEPKNKKRSGNTYGVQNSGS